MNEFAYLARVYCAEHHAHDLLDMWMRLAQVPCGPLYASQLSPDRKLAAYVATKTLAAPD